MQDQFFNTKIFHNGNLIYTSIQIQMLAVDKISSNESRFTSVQMYVDNKCNLYV